MRANEKYVIGLDGGGTKTVAELFNLEGKVLADVRGGPSNFQVIGEDKAAEVILNLCEECCRTAGVVPEDIGAVVAGLTGAGRENDQQRMVEVLNRFAAQRNLEFHRFVVESDARIALEGAFSGHTGIIAIAGTGSIVLGKDENGAIYRAGGWGRIVGDEGSGYAIGREAFRAAARVLDGRLKKSLVFEYLKSEHNLGNQRAIVDALYKQGFDVASVVPLVLKAAEEKDQPAMDILHQAADDLLEVIEAVVKKMRAEGKKKIPLAFVGSLLTNENYYSRVLKRTIHSKLHLVEVHNPEGSPVKGAGVMGRKMLVAPTD